MPSRRVELSPWKQFKARWKDGCGAPICPGATRRCLARGDVPCDVLFIGEAPGESENVCGVPFIGPAGKLLDVIVSRAFQSAPGLKWAFTNVVACIPREADGAKAGEPEDESVLACKPRLEEFIAMCSPRLVVAVGSVAEGWLDQGYKHSIQLPSPRPAQIAISHPAYILRSNVAMRGLAVQRAVVTISNALEDLCPSDR
jgi:DNA polymerase